MFKVFVRFRTTLPEMVRVLNVAEKNDAAKSLADVMSRGGYRKREGFSRFNKIYEFDYGILNQQCTMSMTSVSGHLLGMDFGTQYRKWNSCSPTTLFDIPVIKSCPENYVDIKRTLEREIRGCRYLIIWTDGDREGENIGFEIIQVCQAVKPNIEVYRARFSEITPQAVNRAVNNLQAPDKRVSDAVDVRQELDLRIGAAFTRFQTLRLQKVFPEHLSQQLVSYGSCQFPTLGFVVERYKQVQAFIPEPFWKLKVSHHLDDIKAEFLWKRNRLFNHLACLVLYEQCIERPLATVTEVKSKSKSKWRPQALDTVEMEKLASRKLRINAKETMKIAEKLYTQGYISYPRTETNIFPKELDIRGLVQEQTRDQNWGEFAQRVLDQGPHPRSGHKTDNAHPPIHPIKYTANLQGNEQRVYEFIVRHFLACCSQDAQGMETTVEINIAEERFTASGLMIIAKNYLEVYPYEKWNAKEIPVYKQGDQFEPSVIEMACSETSPPPLLSEADLIALMEKHGIGTDATHADHIETIKDRSYVGLRPDSRFVPGQLGMGLVEGYDEMGYQMSKPHLRSELEADLQRICEGKKQKDVVLRAQIEKYKAVFIEACRQATKLDEALSQYFGEAHALTGAEVTDISGPAVVRKCPLCGQDMALKSKKDGKGFYIGCMGYPQCRAAIWLPDFVLQAEVTEDVCQQCQPGPVQLIKFTFRRGSTPPMIPSEYIGCIGGCDQMLTDVLNIQPLAPRNNNAPPQNPAPRGSRSSPSGSGYGSNGNTNNTARQQHQPHAGNNRRNNNGNRSFTTTTNVPNNFGAGNHQPRGGNPRLPLASLPQSNASTGGWTGDSGDSGSSIVCSCGTDAVQLTVRKEGPNTGRQFYKCSKPSGSGCTFFLWADENNTSSTSGNSSRLNNSWSSTQASHTRPSNNTWGQSAGDGDSVVCGCGQTAKFLTVQKEGPNKGRQFYGCPKPREQSCKFFQWADENDGGGGGGGFGGGGGVANETRRNSNTFGNSSRLDNSWSSSQASHSRPSNNTWGQSSGDGDSVVCGCGQTAKFLTVQKEGPNKGRQFYGCPKPREQSCKFFQWADENDGGGGGGGFSGGGGGGGGGWGGGGGGRGKKRFASGDAGGPSGKKRKCSLCGEEGHTKRTCPQKGPS